MSTNVKVRIETEASAKELQQYRQEAAKLLDTLKLGAGIDIGGKLVNSLGLIPGLIKQSVLNGIAFNSTLEQGALGIAALLKQFQPQKYKDFNDAIRDSKDALKDLKVEALKSPASFEGLIGALKGTAGFSLAAGIPLKQQVGLINQLSQAVKGLDLPDIQLLSELRAILSGNINQNATLAKTIGISSEDIANAKEAGKLYEYLTEKTNAFAVANGYATESYAVQSTNLSDLAQQIQGSLTEVSFDELKAGLKEISVALAKPEFKQGLQAMAGDIAAIVKAGASLVKVAIDNADKISLIIRLVGDLIVVLTAVKLTQYIAVLGSAAVALGAETLALKANTAARAENNAVRGVTTSSGIPGQAAPLEGAIGSAVKVAALGGFRGFLAQATALAAANPIAVVIAFEVGWGIGRSISKKFFSPVLAMFGFQNEDQLAQFQELQDRLNKQKDELRDRLKPALFDGSVKSTSADVVNLKTAVQNQIVDLSKEAAPNKMFQQELAAQRGVYEQYLKMLDAIPEEQLKANDAEQKRVANLEETNERIKKNQDAIKALGTDEAKLFKARQDAALDGAGSDIAKLGMLTDQEAGLQARKANIQVPKILDAGSKDFDQQLAKIKERNELETQLIAIHQQQIKLRETIFGKLTAEDEQLRKQRDVLIQAGDEASIAQLRIDGKNEEARLAEKNLRLQTEATQLSKEANVSYAEALVLVTKKSDAEELAAQRARRIRQEEIDAQRRLSAIESDITLLQGDPFQTQEQKKVKLFELLQREREELKKNIDAWRAYIEANQDSEDPQVQQNVQDRIDRLAQASEKIAQINNEVKTLNFSGGVQSELTAWVDSFGTTAQQVSKVITGTLGAAIDGISSGITGLINGTMTWRQAMQNTVSSIIANLVQIVVQMVVMNTVGKMLTVQNTATQVAAGGTIAGAVAPAAAGMSIASFGGAATAGLVAATAAIALIIGMLALGGGGLGFEEGGLIPGAPSHSDNRVAMVASGEYVARTAAVQHYGPGLFAALNSMSIPRDWFHGMRAPAPGRSASLGFASGGYVGPAAGGSGSGGDARPVINFALVNSRQEMKEFMAREGAKMAFDYTTKRTTELGVRG